MMARYYDDYLAHSGRKGQTKGHRNGPPYPLLKQVVSSAYPGQAPAKDARDANNSEKDFSDKIKAAAKSVKSKWDKHVEESKKKKAAKQAEQERQEAERRTKEAEARKKRILSDPSLLYEHRNEFTNQELSDAIARFDLESKLSNVVSKSKPKERFEDNENLRVSNIQKTIKKATKTNPNNPKRVYENRDYATSDQLREAIEKYKLEDELNTLLNGKKKPSDNDNKDRKSEFDLYKVLKTTNNYASVLSNLLDNGIKLHDNYVDIHNYRTKDDEKKKTKIRSKDDKDKKKEKKNEDK